MKTLFLVLGALLTIHSAALAGDIANVVVSAAQPVASVQLVDQKFEPIYGEEPYEATCAREVLDHMQTVCHTENSQVCQGGQEVCENVRGSVCRNNVCTDVVRRECHTTARTCTDVPRRVCSDQAVYRTDYYSCTRYRTVVVGQRLVKTFNHAIEVVLQDAAALGSASLNIVVQANQLSLSARLAGSFPQNILNHQIIDLPSTDSGAVAQINKRIVISLGLPAALANKILAGQLLDLELGHEAAKMKLANVSELIPHLKLAIRIKRNRAIGGDSTLFDDVVNSSKLSLVAQAADILAIIPFEKLGIDSLNSKKHDIRVSVSLNAGNVLNAQDFSAALSKTLDGELKRVNPSF